jgi:hypothetical protein
VAIFIFTIFAKKTIPMIDLEYLFPRKYLTDNRKKNFKSIAKQNQAFYNCCGGYFSNAQYQRSNAEL